jgi:hypothetical protein
MKRAALTAIITVVALIILVQSPFILSSARFQWTTRKWEAKIKREQDPEKLRAWAKELMTRYQNNAFEMRSMQTNKPPVGITMHNEFTSIYYANAETNGQAKLDPTQDFVDVAWDFGAWTGIWGIQIGDTNFVGRSEKPQKWKPGIYFYRGGPD